MNFTVYRTSKDNGRATVIAKTYFLEDATSVLKNWYSGYIMDGNGSLIYSKLGSKLNSWSSKLNSWS